MLHYLIILALLMAFELLYFQTARRFNITDKPNSRSSHTQITLRGGGIVFFFGALLFFIASKGQYPWFMAGLTLIAAVSFVDDVRSLSPRVRLPLHFIAILLMFEQWQLFSAVNAWHLLILLVVCAGIINVFNFMDGINGITGGYALVTLLTLLYINATMVPFIESGFIVCLCLAAVVFCVFNFRRRAICFAGDVGSVSMAFVIIFLLLKLSLQSHDVSWITLLAVYGVDGVLTIAHRIMLHENISQPHRKHAFQIMANELRLPHTTVSLLYMAMQLLINVWFILWHSYTTLLLSVLLLSLLYILFIKKFFHPEPDASGGHHQHQPTNTTNTSSL